RAERERSTRAQDRGRAPRLCCALGPEPLGPRIAAVGQAPLHMLHLHRGRDARSAQSRDVARIEALEVLDAMHGPVLRPAPDRFIKADGLTDRAISDGVRGNLKAGGSELANRLPQRLLVNPERLKPIAVG